MSWSHCMCLDNKAIQLLQAINQLIDRAVTNNAIQSTGTVVLPACIRLLFPFFIISACNKRNQETSASKQIKLWIFLIGRGLLTCLSHIRIYNGLIIRTFMSTDVHVNRTFMSTFHFTKRLWRTEV